MAYDNNNDGKSTSVYENYGTVFGDGKAYSIGRGNNKFRISIASQLKNNGNPQWDFKNQTGISVDTDDLYRILLAAKQLTAIHNTIRTNPSLVNGGDPMYSVRQIRLPLAAKSTGRPYGDFIIGMRPDDNEPGKFVFYIQYKYQTKDNSEVTDYFYFRRAIGAEGTMVYCNENGVEIKSTHTEQLQFANFIQKLENAVGFGDILQGIHTALKYGGSSGGYRRSGYNSSPSGAPGGNGGYSGGPSNVSNDPSEYPDDIPF